MNLRAKEIRVFHPANGASFSLRLIVKWGKYLVCRNVFALVNRLHDVACTHGKSTTRLVLPLRPRGVSMSTYLGEKAHMFALNFVRIDIERVVWA